MPIVTLEQVSIAFGHLPLLDGVALQIEAHERVSLIGRNGTGKSTLLQIIAGDLEPDSGSVWRQPGVRIARLAQDAPPSTGLPNFKDDPMKSNEAKLEAIQMAWHEEYQER